MYSFDFSEKNVISFTVDYNESEYRETEVSVTLPNTEAKPVCFMVRQDAGERRPRFAIEIQELTEASVTATIIPADPCMKYLRFCVTRALYDETGSDSALFSYYIETYERVAAGLNMSLMEYFEEYNHLFAGESTYEVGSLRPATDYYICAVGIGADGNQADEMIRAPFTTPDVVPCTTTFDISYDISGPIVTTVVTPSDNDQLWDFNFIKAASIEKEDIAEAFQSYIDKAIKEYQGMLGWSEAEIVKELIAKKGRKEFTDELDAETEYYGFVVPLNPIGIINAVPTVKEFRTGKVTVSGNSLILEITEVKDREIKFQTTTTNEDPYVLIVDKSSSFDGLADEQIIDKLTRFPYNPDNSKLTGSQAGTIDALEPNTEYSAFAFGWLGGVATTELVRRDFTTTSHVDGAASMDLIYDKYFDGSALSQEYPGLFAAYLYAGKAVLPVEVSLTGEYEAFYYNIMVGAPETPEGYEEYLYRTLRNQGHVTRTFYISGYYGEEYTLTGYAVDKNGHYGPIMWKKITFSQSGASPVSEFTPAE